MLELLVSDEVILHCSVLTHCLGFDNNIISEQVRLNLFINKPSDNSSFQMAPRAVL